MRLVSLAFAALALAPLAAAAQPTADGAAVPANPSAPCYEISPTGGVVAGALMLVALRRRHRQRHSRS